MKIYRLLLIELFLCCSLLANGEQHVYIKGQNHFEITETKSEYQVYCSREGNVTTSRNKNITDRQLRMDAVDLIGSYIVYRSSNLSKKLSPKYFQVYVEGLCLHYYAILEGLRRDNVSHNGKQCILYACNKEAYNIQSATYNSNVDLSQCLSNHYTSNRCEESANLLYCYDGFTSEQYLDLERDFLTGDAKIPSTIRALHGVSDRFEKSAFSSGDKSDEAVFLNAKAAKIESAPYCHFYLEEMVTAAPLSSKKEYYAKWSKPLKAKGCVYESILKFCSEHCCKDLPDRDGLSLTDVIEAFPGAISPFGIRQPINEDSYNRATQAYSKSEFEKAYIILKGIVDTEGISPKVLNLLGASCRLLGKNNEAMAYLLLGLKLNPTTQYLTGNIFLTMRNLKFIDINELEKFLIDYADDSWSKDVMSTR